MLKRGIFFCTAAAALVLSVGCGNSLDTEEAERYCTEAKSADSTCWDSAAYQGCVTCYEDCGVDCSRDASSCPARFSCD